VGKNGTLAKASMFPSLTRRGSRFRRVRCPALTIALCATVLNTPRAHAADQDEERDESASSVQTDTLRQTNTTECVEAHASAQELKQAGQLVESRAQLLRCSRDNCPDLVRSECLNMIDDLRAQIPTVVLRVTVDGESSVDVQVYMDEKLLFSEVPTRAFDLNPGKHRFVFRYRQLAPIEREVAITDGERLVPIVVRFVTPPQPREVPLEPPKAPHRSIPWSVYGLSGVGAIGLGGFVGFGLATRSKENDLKSTCSPACSQSAIDSVERRAKMADYSLGFGLVALAAAAAAYFLTTGTDQSPSTGASMIPKALVPPRMQFDF
jgi:hypothetical protein